METELVNKIMRIVDNLKLHSGWISKDILYDKFKGDDDICVVDYYELKTKLKKCLLDENSAKESK